MKQVASQRQGEVAIVLGAGIWELFWIPLRYLDENGVQGLWAVAFIMAAAIPISLGAALYSRELRRADLGTIALIGSLIGIAVTLYFAAIVFTDVLRAVFLFYLLPIWATILARVLHGEPIGPRRLVAIAVAFGGLWLFLGGEGGLPLPKNAGDWMAICSGISWAFCIVTIKHKPDVGSFANSAAPFIFGSGLATVAAIFLVSSNPFPDPSAIRATAPIALAFGTLMLWPSILGQVWGAKLVPAPRAALLSMTEILFATISAYLLIGTSLTLWSAFGGVAIIVAVLIDIGAQTNPNKTETTNGREAV